ncbi:MAG: hypothetical protein ACKVX9_10260 [Blastocatellia bacterium]
MSEGFLKRLWPLVRLRYRLIWAHARTGNGKIALLFALYLLGLSLGGLFALSGIGTAVADDEFGQKGFLARWMLTGLFINGVGMSVLFGVSSREAFAEESLRRYPLDQQDRFWVRQIIGLLDPVWMILSMGVIGVAIGMAFFAKGSLLLGLPGALLFIAANYLTTSVLLAVIGLVMQTRRGSALLGVLVLLMISFGPLAISLFAVAKGNSLWLTLDRYLKFTPPGAATLMMIGDTAPKVFGSALLLAGWCAILAVVLRRLEAVRPSDDFAGAGRIEWDDYYDQVAGLFGRARAPYVSKALRYHLRCNIIRFSLITSPLLILFGKFMLPDRSRRGELIITFALFFITSSATGAAMMLNLFGYDGAGIRRYAVLPSRLVHALQAGSIASLLLRGLMMLFAFTVWVALSAYSGSALSPRMLVLVLSIVVASLFLFNALGLWTSVLSPKVADFNAMWNNRLSFGGNVVMIGGVVAPYVIAIVLSEKIDPETMLRFWWLPGLLMLASIGFYLFSLRAVERALDGRRERLINLIAGARDR